MDRPEIREAEGVPCEFQVFEQLERNAWETVRNGMPDALKRIRWLPAERVSQAEEVLE